MYMDALQGGEYEAITDLFYFNPESKKAMKVKEGFSSIMTEKVKPEMEKLGGVKSYEVGEAELNEAGDKAKVPVQITYGNEDQKTQDTEVVLVDGKWYLDLGK